MPTVKQQICIFIMSLLIGFHQAWATTYYVSPNGNNANTGQTLSSPFKTIQAALNVAGNNGDTIYVLSGVYVETVSIRQNNLTLTAYPNNKPVIDGKTTLPNTDWDALMMVDGNYNKISGFELRNSNINGAHLGGYGIQVIGHHNSLNRMQVHHTWQQGILVNGDYNRVENSKVWQCARANSTNGSVGTGGWGTGMSAARNPISGITHYATFRHNTVYNNWGEGLSCFEADHCVMEDNVVYDNWTVNIYLSDASNSIVRRNLVYISSNPAIPQRNNNKVGILLADEVASVPRSKNNRLINNLIYNANFAAFSWTGVYGSGLEGVLIANNTLVNGEFSLSAGGAMAITHHNTQIVNNIFQGNRNSVSSTSGVSFSNNNWLVAPPAVASSVGDVLGDALLQKTGTTTAGTLKADYFKLLSNSPLIDRGLPLLTVTTDYFKQPRTLFPDIGAHEFKK